jgi:tetratricopeptide (TPR) repeat protein
LNPNYEAAYLYRGISLSLKGDDAQAIADFSKAIELYPQNFEAYYQRGISYRYLFIRNVADNKYYTSALSDLNTAIKLEPATAKAYLERAKVYGFNEEFKAAIADLTKVIELDGRNNLDAYCIRRSLYEYSGQKRLADADLASLSGSDKNCRKFKTRTRPGDTY